MAERRYATYNRAGVGRSVTFNPARASMPVMPSSMGYNPGYPGDIHSYPAVPSRYANGSPRYQYNPPPPHPRAHGNTFAVTDDAPFRSSRARDAPPPATRHRRSSTVDSSHPRPIIITTNNSRVHGHNPSARDRSRSPPRDDYRPVDSSTRAQRGSSRTRSVSQHGPAPPYSPTFEVNDDEYAGRTRGPDIIPASGRADAYGSSRPTVVYPTNPRHTTVDVGGQYGYTKPGELALYDLDHPQHTRHRRHESVDHYARPNVYYNPERRGFNIETHRTPDASGPSIRPADGRGGPPPTTWGLEKLNRNSTAFDPVSASPAATLPASNLPGDVTQRNHRERRGSNKHARPVSLRQEAPPRSTRDDGYYRPRDDDRPSRKERDHDQVGFVDDHVPNRGFGIRTDPVPEPDDRRERRERTRRDYADSTRRAEDDYDHDWVRVEPADVHILEDGIERKGRRSRAAYDDAKGGAAGREDDELVGGKRLKENLKAGMGVAASAVGLGHASNKGDKPEREDRDPTAEKAGRKDRKEKERHHRERDNGDEPVFSSDDDDEVEIISARANDRYHPREKVYVSKDHRGRERDRVGPTGRTSDAPASRSRDRRERDAEVPEVDNAPTQPSHDARQPDGESEKPHRKDGRPSFNPNDTGDLDKVKEELANLKIRDKDDDGERVMVVEPPSGPKEDARPERSVFSGREPSMSGRRDTGPPPEGKSVRVVSPPPQDRERPEAKPIKGILKTPSIRFPEDPNPIREGVAPHKNDEKLKEVPPGARWTRISRKIVNPDALKAKQERFEVRDDFVIVLRVLSREEIENYANLTARLRGEFILPIPYTLINRRHRTAVWKEVC